MKRSYAKNYTIFKLFIYQKLIFLPSIEYLL